MDANVCGPQTTVKVTIVYDQFSMTVSVVLRVFVRIILQVLRQP